jgi:uncharacterized LabA/DUF88 family protein
MTDKAAVFIDGGYLQKVTEAFADTSKLSFSMLPRIDFRKLSDVLCPPSKCERFRTYYYDCPPYQGSPPTDDEKRRVASRERFLHALNELPRFEVRLGRLNKITLPDGSADYRQKGVDVSLSLDLAKLSWNHHIQRAILLTGDSDFVPAVKQAKEAGVTVEVYYCTNGECRIHDKLYQECDERFEIDVDFIKMVKCGDYKRLNHPDQNKD